MSAATTSRMKLYLVKDAEFNMDRVDISRMHNQKGEPRNFVQSVVWVPLVTNGNGTGILLYNAGDPGQVKLRQELRQLLEQIAAP